MNVFNKRLESQRLILRKLNENDAFDMYEYTSDPASSEYLEWDPHITIDQTRIFIKKAIQEYESITNSFIWGIELKDKSKLIGVLRIYDFSNKDKRSEISYILNSDFQGKGYMTESILTLFDYYFNTLGFNRIQAKCPTLNSSSEKIMKRTGMTQEGILRDFSFIRGRYHDILLYAITRKDYLKKD